MDYNYESFDAYVEAGVDLEEFGRWPSMLHAGERAPDGTLTRLDDCATVTLAELWVERPVVLEFGSFT